MGRKLILFLFLIIGPLPVLSFFWFRSAGKTCRSQSDCLRHQCCVNRNTRARRGTCMSRKTTGEYCHNPRRTGAHHVWCPGPPGIIHPDLCPCTCGEFCAIGFNPRRDRHGGYYGTCTFG